MEKMTNEELAWTYFETLIEKLNNLENHLRDIDKTVIEYGDKIRDLHLAVNSVIHDWHYMDQDGNIINPLEHSTPVEEKIDNGYLG